MPNIIALNLLQNKSIVATMQGIPLANENSYKIIAGEENVCKKFSSPAHLISIFQTIYNNVNYSTNLFIFLHKNVKISALLYPRLFHVRQAHQVTT